MNITHDDITNLTDEELAAACIRSGDDTMKDLGRELQSAVDDEADSSEIRQSIKAHIEA